MRPVPPVLKVVLIAIDRFDAEFNATLLGVLGGDREYAGNVVIFFSVGGRPVRSPIPPNVTPDKASAPMSAVLSIALQGTRSPRPAELKPMQSLAGRKSRRPAGCSPQAAYDCGHYRQPGFKSAISIKSILADRGRDCLSAPAWSQYIVHIEVCTPKPCMILFLTLCS
jgi:hypothetical protein